MNAIVQRQTRTIPRTRFMHRARNEAMKFNPAPKIVVTKDQVENHYKIETLKYYAESAKTGLHTPSIRNLIRNLYIVKMYESLADDNIVDICNFLNVAPDEKNYFTLADVI